MAEQVILVCDVCGKPAKQSVTFNVGRRNLSQDLCGTHLQELIRTSHGPSRRRRSKGITKRVSKAEGRKRTSRRRPTGSSTARPARKRITDPATLEKRRAALAKARQALAKKRAAAKSSS
jgi:hypothetical protein